MITHIIPSKTAIVIPSHVALSTLSINNLPIPAQTTNPTGIRKMRFTPWLSELLIILRALYQGENYNEVNALWILELAKSEYKLI